MTDLSMAAEAIIGLVALAGLGFVIYGPWQWVCTDIARQRIFRVRDAIFDMAADGELSFQSAEYRAIRLSLERSIRFHHELTWPRFLYLYLSMRRSGGLDGPSEIDKAKNSITNPETRKKLTKLLHDAEHAATEMMLAKSPLFLIVFALFWVSAIVLRRFALGTFRYMGSLITHAEQKIGKTIEMEAERYEPKDRVLVAT